MKNTKLFVVLSSIIFSICFVLNNTKIASADYPAVYGGNGTSTATFASVNLVNGKIRIGFEGVYGGQIDLIAGSTSQKSKTCYGYSCFELETLSGNIRFSPTATGGSGLWISVLGGGNIWGDADPMGVWPFVGIEISSNKIRAWSWAYIDANMSCMDGFCYGPWINLGYTCPSGGTLSGTTCVTPIAPTCTASWNLPGPLTAPGSSTFVVSSQNATSATYSCTEPGLIANNVSFSPSSSIVFNNIGAGTKNCTVNLTGPGGTVNNACSKSLIINSVPACTGVIPTNSILAAVGDDVPAVDTPRTLVAADTTAKCEYMCNTGYHYNAGVCEQNCTSECIDTMTPCSKTCGGGTQSCTRKLPDCTESVVVTSCNEQACPTVKRNLNWREVSPN